MGKDSQERIRSEDAGNYDVIGDIRSEEIGEERLLEEDSDNITALINEFCCADELLVEPKVVLMLIEVLLHVVREFKRV